MQLRSDDLLTRWNGELDERKFTSTEHRWLSTYFKWDVAPVITVRTPQYAADTEVQPIDNHIPGGQEDDAILGPTVHEDVEWVMPDDDVVLEVDPDGEDTQAGDLYVQSPEDTRHPVVSTIPLIEINLI